MNSTKWEKILYLFSKPYYSISFIIILSKEKFSHGKCNNYSNHKKKKFETDKKDYEKITE